MNKTKAQYLEKVKKNGYFLEEIERKDKTFEICLAAVRQNGMALEFVEE